MARSKRKRAEESSTTDGGDDQVAVLFGVWRNKGRGPDSGWVTCRAVVPRRLLEEHAVELDVELPNVAEVAMGRIVRDVQRAAMEDV